MTLLFPFCLLFTDLLAIILLLPLHLLLLFLPFPKLLLLSLLFKPLILQIILSILPIFLVPSPIQDIVFPGSPPEFPYFGIPLPGTSSTFSETVSLPYCPISSRIAPTAKPKPFFSIESQPMASSGPRRRHGRGSRGTHSGRRRAPRGRRGRATSTTSSQTSPIPSYLWPDHQPSLVPSKGPSADEALNLATKPRVFNYFPDSLPPSPF